MTRVYEAVTDMLADEGADIAFAIMGDANQELLVDMAERGGIRLVHCRHEQNAVGMADGYTRFSSEKRIGVAAVTMGPGLTNTATSLVAARERRSPVLVLAGAPSLSDLRNPQRFDQLAFSRLLAGAGEVVESPDGLEAAMRDALGHIHAGRGPFVLNLPASVQKQSMRPGWTYRRRYVARAPTDPAEGDLGRATDLIRCAERPAILCGLGAVLSDAGAEIGRLAERLGAPVATSLPARGFLGNTTLHLGACGGLGEGVAHRVLREADVIIVFGASLTQWTTQSGTALGRSKLVQIDLDPDVFGRHTATTPEVAVLGDAKLTAARILNALGDRPRASTLAPLVEQARREPRPAADDSRPDGGADPRDVARCLDELLPPDQVVVLAGAHANFYVSQALRITSARRFAYVLEFCALGQGLGIALGATFARPGQRINYVVTDGELAMSLQDLATAASYHVPLSIVVLSDGGYGQERHGLRHKGLADHHAMMPAPDFAQLMRGFGGHGDRHTPGADLMASLKGFFSASERRPGPSLLHIDVDGGIENHVSLEIARSLGKERLEEQ